MRALPPPPSTTDSAGGQGAGTPGPSIEIRTEPADFSRSDARLFSQAIRGRWPMSEEMRARVVDQLMRLVTAGGDIDPRAQVAAAKALIDADRVNIEEAAAAIPAPRVIETTGGPRLDFSAMSYEDLDRFVAAGGTV